MSTGASTASGPPAGLPLLVATPPAWVGLALDRLPELLVDHAHCELKAASAAIASVTRYSLHPSLVQRLLPLAHEELRHFREVSDELELRGIPLAHPQRDRYVRTLRERTCSEGRGIGDLGDRMLLDAFVEARSCERFRLLAPALLAGEGDEARLGALYQRLGEAESRHWEIFFDLACEACGAAEAQRRLAEVARIESDVLSHLPAGPYMHAGWQDLSPSAGVRMSRCPSA